MRHLPLDPRGYPIFEMIVRDATGKALFAVNDEMKRQRLLNEDRCPLCGKPLTRARWLVGGPLSAFTDTGAYLDPPMHHECMVYALKVCPYLAAPRWASEGMGLATVKHADFGGLNPAFTEDRASIKRRPDVFVAIQTVGQTYVIGDVNPVTENRTDLPDDHPARFIAKKYIRPKHPLRQIEYWLGGQQIAEEEGLRLSAQSMETDLMAGWTGLPNDEATAP